MVLDTNNLMALTISVVNSSQQKKPTWWNTL